MAAMSEQSLDGESASILVHEPDVVASSASVQQCLHSTSGQPLSRATEHRLRARDQTSPPA